MSLSELKRVMDQVDIAADKCLTDEEVLKSYVVGMRVAILRENDVEYGLEIGKKAKRYIESFIREKSNGGDFKWLEEFSQRNKHPFGVIDQYYEVLKLEAPFLLDSFKLFLEKNRPRKERFYEPRRGTLYRITDAVQRLEEDKLDILFLHQPPRTGKLLADDTPVFTSEGWKKHGDLVVGDKVIGSDGNYTEVTKVFEKNVANYKVTLSNGETIRCHANHEWTVWDRSAQKYHTYETHELVNRLKNNNCEKRNNLFLPLRQIMQGESKELLISPYVLGAWIGDGTNNKPWITDPISDFPIIEKIINDGYSLRKIYTHKKTGVKTFVFETKFMKDLQQYGMCFYDKKCNKHIPKDYITASIDQRLELLAGLIDTDGTLIKSEHRYKFSTVNPILKDDFLDLINTFGWRACVSIEHPKPSSYGIVGKKTCYIISFNPTCNIPCKLERKKLDTFSNQRRIAIKCVEPCDEVPGNCISVKNSDGLYAVGKTMQLTHNSGDLTMDTVWHCSRDTEKSNLYVTYKEGLGGAFLQGVSEIMIDPTYCYKEVFPDVKIVSTDAKNNKMDLGRVKKYKTLSGKGLESGLNGEYDAHGWMIIDDPLEGIQDVMSKDVLRRKQVIFDNNVLSRKKENCKVICMGTLWATDDLFMNYLDFIQTSPEMKDTRYEVIKIPALDPKTDESNFNYEYGVGFTTKYYRGVRSKFENNEDLAGWQCQYMQDPIDRTGAVFNPEHMKYYTYLPSGQPIKVITHVDVSLGGGDFLSMPVVYYFENDEGVMEGYVEDVVFDNSEKQITQPEVLAMIKRHKIKHVHFEANQGGEAYADEIKKMIKEDSDYKEVCNITSDWALTTKRKFQRIFDNAGEIRELYFKDPQHQTIQYRRFMNNLFAFSENLTKKDHDDAPDSLSGLIDFEKHGTGIRKARIINSPI